MRYEVHGITKTMVEFLPNEVQARVILLQGDAFIVSFPSSHNFHSGGHFVKLMSAMFDRFAPTADKVTIDNIKRINAELYLADYEMIGNICPDQDKHEERKRICTELAEAITGLAKALPEHRVVPYLNIPKNQYPKNTDR